MSSAACRAPSVRDPALTRRGAGADATGHSDGAQAPGAPGSLFQLAALVAGAGAACDALRAAAREAGAGDAAAAPFAGAGPGLAGALGVLEAALAAAAGAEVAILPQLAACEPLTRGMQQARPRGCTAAPSYLQLRGRAKAPGVCWQGAPPACPRRPCAEARGRAGRAGHPRLRAGGAGAPRGRRFAGRRRAPCGGGRAAAAGAKPS